MRSTEGRAVGLDSFYCEECKKQHPKYIAQEHPHYSDYIMRQYRERRKEQEKIAGG